MERLSSTGSVCCLRGKELMFNVISVNGEPWAEIEHTSTCLLSKKYVLKC